MVKKFLVLMIMLVSITLNGCNASGQDYQTYQKALDSAQCEVILSIDTKYDSLFITPKFEADNYQLIEMSDLDRRNGRLDHYVDAGPWKHYLRGTDEPYFLCTEFAKGKPIELDSELITTDFSGDGTDLHVGYNIENTTGNFILVQVEHKDKKYFDIVLPYRKLQNLHVFHGIAKQAILQTFELVKLEK